MQAMTTMVPDVSDRPTRFMSGRKGDIPVLYLDRLYGRHIIHFYFNGTSTVVDAVAYLRRLSDEAIELAEDIERTQRS